MLRTHPLDPLAQLVEACWWSRGAASDFTRERALPTGAMTLVINLGSEPIRIFRDESDQQGWSFRHSVVWGPQTRYAVRDAGRKGAVVGIHFRPGRAGAVLGLPASELTDRFVSLEELWGSRAGNLRQRALDAATPHGAIAAVQRLLLPVQRPLLPHPAVAHALFELGRPDAPSIENIRSDAGHSARRFIELFTAATGTTPKRYSRLKRFERVLEQAGRGGRMPEWARIAAENGFTDQAHLSHEFKAFSGLTPGAYKPLEGRPHHVPEKIYKSSRGCCG